MTNKLQSMIKELEQGSNLKILSKSFSNEIVSNHSVQCSVLGGTTFYKVNFRNIDFTGSNIVTCKFKDCTFDNVILVKCEFWDSSFENCQIKESNLVRADLYDSKFKNCNFTNVNLTASYFSNFEFIETKFKNSQLDSLAFHSVKISRSKQSVEVGGLSSFTKILKEMNFILKDS